MLNYTQPQKYIEWQTPLMLKYNRMGMIAITEGTIISITNIPAHILPNTNKVISRRLELLMDIGAENDIRLIIWPEHLCEFVEKNLKIGDEIIVEAGMRQFTKRVWDQGNPVLDNEGNPVTIDYITWTVHDIGVYKTRM